MADVIYDVVCPGCGRRAWARMVAGRLAGTYREPRRRNVARRIGCDHCGRSQEVSPARGEDYRLWFRVDFQGHTLWANNEVHLDFLIAWLEGDLDPKRLEFPDRALVEALPRWMLQARRAVAERLRRLKARG